MASPSISSKLPAEPDLLGVKTEINPSSFPVAICSTLTCPALF